MRVVLVVRDPATFTAVLDEQLTPGTATATPALTLTVAGGPGDRRRFFANAVRGYLGLGRGAELPAWARPERGSVGDDGETIVWTHARAALAALADDPATAVAMRTAEPAALTADVVTRERRRWAATVADPHWQVGPPLVARAQEEAVLCLLLRRPKTIEDAVATLRQLPRFRARDEDSVRNIADWARHLYPGPGAWLNPRPALLDAALLAAALHPRHAGLLDALDLPAAAAGDPRILLHLATTAAGFPDLGALLGRLVTGPPGATNLLRLIEAVTRSGPDGPVLQPHLVAALTTADLTLADADRLLQLASGPQWQWLHVALHGSRVRYLRRAASPTTEEQRMAVARALLALAAAHTRVGDHRAAATTTQEAVGLYRELADLNRDAHLPALAMAVGNLATRLADALRAAQEAAQLYRLARQIHGDVYADDMSDAVRLVNSLTDTVGEVDGGRPSDP